MTFLIDWFLDEDSGKDQLNNMSCRSRTTVNSDPLPRSLLPEMIKGIEIRVTLERPACHMHYMLKKDPKYNDHSIFHALYILGSNREQKDYEELISRTKKPDMELLDLLNEPPETLKWLPEIGVVAPEHKGPVSNMIIDTRSAMYLLSHTNDTLFIKNKSPILKGIAPGRRVIIRHYQLFGIEKITRYRRIKRRHA